MIDQTGSQPEGKQDKLPRKIGKTIQYRAKVSKVFENYRNVFRRGENLGRMPMRHEEMITTSYDAETKLPTKWWQNDELTLARRYLATRRLPVQQRWMKVLACLLTSSDTSTLRPMWCMIWSTKSIGVTARMSHLSRIRSISSKRWNNNAVGVNWKQRKQLVAQRRRNICVPRAVSVCKYTNYHSSGA